jgi:hypothetical protein
MLGKNHENIIDFVVRDKRSVLKFLGFDLPDDVSVEAERGLDLTEADPKQLLADGQIVIGKPPTFGLVIEVQTTMTRKDWKEKQFKWPHYAIGLRSALKCLTSTLVITINPRIEKLARKPIQIGLNWWQAMVIGPSNLPRDLSVEFARTNPTLVLLTMMAHGQTYTSPETPAAMLQGLWESELYQSLENEQQRIYYDRALQTLPLWIAQALTEDPMTQEYFSPVVLNYVEQGRVEGREEGREEGIERGIEAGLRQSILLLLDSRGYVTTDDDLQRIENEHDRSMLETWVKAAANQVAEEPFFDDH